MLLFRVDFQLWKTLGPEVRKTTQPNSLGWLVQQPSPPHGKKTKNSTYEVHWLHYVAGLLDDGSFIYHETLGAFGSNHQPSTSNVPHHLKRIQQTDPEVDKKSWHGELSYGVWGVYDYDLTFATKKHVVVFVFLLLKSPTPKMRKKIQVGLENDFIV